MILVKCMNIPSVDNPKGDMPIMVLRYLYLCFCLFIIQGGRVTQKTFDTTSESTLKLDYF